MPKLILNLLQNFIDGFNLPASVISVVSSSVVEMYVVISSVVEMYVVISSVVMVVVKLVDISPVVVILTKNGGFGLKMIFSLFLYQITFCVIKCSTVNI